MMVNKKTVKEKTVNNIIINTNNKLILGSPKNKLVPSSKKILKLVLSCLIINLVSGCSTTNLNTKRSNEIIELSNLSDAKKIIKKVFDANSISSNHNYSSNIRPEFDGKNIFFASKNGEVIAKTLAGKKLWHVNTKYRITGGLSYDVVSKTLVFSTKNGMVVALDGKSGELKWQRQLSGSIITPAAISNAQNIVVLSGNNGVLHGLYLKTGLPAWSYTTPTPKISIRGTAIPVLHKDIAVFATADGRINILDATSGISIWSKQVGDINTIKRVDYLKDIDASPIFDGDYMYSVTYGGKLTAFNLSNKTLAFSQDVASLKQLLVLKNLLIVVSNNSEIHAYDKIKGNLIWKNKTLKNRGLTNPVYMSRHIVIGDKKGYIHLLDINSGQTVSREKTEGQLDYLEVIDYKLITQSKEDKVSVWQ